MEKPVRIPWWQKWCLQEQGCVMFMTVCSAVFPSCQDHSCIWWKLIWQWWAVVRPELGEIWGRQRLGANHSCPGIQMLATVVLTAMERIQTMQERLRDVSKSWNHSEREWWDQVRQLGAGRAGRNVSASKHVAVMLNMIPWDPPVKVTPQRRHLKWRERFWGTEFRGERTDYAPQDLSSVY